MGSKKSIWKNPPYLILCIILALLTFTFIYPFWNMYVYAFSDGLDAAKGSLYFWPRKFTFDNLIVALRYEGVLNGAWISLAITVSGTLFSMVAISTWAYAMTKRHLPGYALYSTFFFVPFLFSGGSIAHYLLLKEIGLIDTFWVFILPGAYSYYTMIIFRSYFDTIPASIEESAELDGAGHFTIFFRLIVPISKPTFAALTLFKAVGLWSDWYAGMFYVKNPKLVPLQTILQRLLNQLKLVVQPGGTIDPDKITPQVIRLAIVVITVTPIIMIYPMLQKYFVKGIMIGSVKG